MPRYNNPKRTLKYTNEFKVKAVQLSILDGIRVKEVAQTLDIHPTCCPDGEKSTEKE